MAEEVTSPEKLPKAPPVLPDDEVLYELADLFRVFGDSTRIKILYACLLYTSPSPRDRQKSRMPSSA